MNKEKKILIYKNKDTLRPVGGPTGYLYNLNKELENRGIKDIEFLKSCVKLGDTTKIKIRKVISQILPQCIEKKLVNFKFLINILMDKEVEYTDFRGYDIIHFHSTINLYNNRKALNTYKGKILLTSHSPQPFHKEIVTEQFSKGERLIYGKLLNKIEVVDEYAFNKADYIIFPCKEAEEPYFNNWIKYKEIKENKKAQYRYLPTGIPGNKNKLTKEDVLSKYNIPKDSFIISYVGRHNEVKGYDILMKIGEKIIQKHNNVYFIIAGKEEPLKGLKNDRWIEAGWTNDPHSLIAASDVFILPNRETYFDLILLEVMSLGKTIIASNTGGNKFFKKFDEKSITYFNSVNDAVIEIERLMNLSINERIQLGNKNYKLFLEEFNSSIFVDRFLDIINNI